MVRGLKDGDPDAFKALFDRYKRQLFYFILGLVRSDDAAEELTHDVFLKVWETRSRLDEELSLSGYLHTIARNHVFNHLKRAATERRLSQELLRRSDTAHNPVEDQCITSEYEQLANQAIAQMPPKRQQVYQLCAQEEQSYEAVATQLDISRDAVKDHMVKARKFLRLFFRRYADLSLLLFSSLFLK